MDVGRHRPPAIPQMVIFSRMGLGRYAILTGFPCVICDYLHILLLLGLLGTVLGRFMVVMAWDDPLLRSGWFWMLTGWYCLVFSQAGFALEKCVFN
jgi:hypothetical protein